MLARRTTLAIALTLVVGCNAILGNEDRSLAPSGAGSAGKASDGTAGSGSGATGGRGGSAGNDAGQGGDEPTTGGSSGSTATGGKGGGSSGAGGSVDSGGSSGAGGRGGKAGSSGKGSGGDAGMTDGGTGGDDECNPACEGSTPYCLAKTCVECLPDTHQCSSPTKTQTCGADGSWGTPTSCTGKTPICNQQTGICTKFQLVGGFTTLGAAPPGGGHQIVDAEFRILPRTCDGTNSVCIRGGFRP